MRLKKRGVVGYSSSSSYLRIDLSKQGHGVLMAPLKTLLGEQRGSNTPVHDHVSHTVHNLLVKLDKPGRKLLALLCQDLRDVEGEA